MSIEISSFDFRSGFDFKMGHISFSKFQGDTKVEDVWDEEENESRRNNTIDGALVGGRVALTLGG